MNVRYLSTISCFNERGVVLTDVADNLVHDIFFALSMQHGEAGKEEMFYPIRLHQLAEHLITSLPET